MKNFFLTVLATVVAASIVAIAALQFQFAERLARIETRLDAIEPKHLVSK